MELMDPSHSAQKEPSSKVTWSTGCSSDSNTTVGEGRFFLVQFPVTVLALRIKCLHSEVLFKIDTLVQ